MNEISKMNRTQALRKAHSHMDCDRGKVAAIIFSADGSVLASGKNGLPACLSPCKCNDGADTYKMGSATCKAGHAEVNALLALKGNDWKAHSIYVTRPPCRTCLTHILNTGIKLIVTTDEYPDRDGSFITWDNVGREHLILSMNNLES